MTPLIDPVTHEMLGRDELDDFVRAFEMAYDERGDADPAEFLAPAGHPLFAAVLCELVRVDLEYRWERGCPKSLAEYQHAFPTLQDNNDGRREIVFEEFRLRRQAGQDPSPAEYLERYGVRLDDRASGRGEAGGGLERFARAYRDVRRSGGEGPDAWSDPAAVGPDARLFRDVYESDPGAADRLALGLSRLPAVGDELAGFRLIGELGRGTFGRVYLARQGDLADRRVVLKVTAESCDESRTLARLQHTNIVPIYSTHRADALQVVCMPFLGRTTLRDVFEDLKLHRTLPASGLGLLSTINSRRADPRRSPEPGPQPVEIMGGPATDGTGPSLSRPAGPKSTSAEALRALGRLTYVEAVLWLAARLGDGLAHAHERGVVHRDIKPANVLLADDGQPLLLDFNLAEDAALRGHASAAAVGGTLPYMAPEHLEAFEGGVRPVDARSDLYSLGVILYELLTGHPPFPVHRGCRARPPLRAMVAERSGPPPGLRALNPAVTPAVESIVRRCLEPDPAHRYQSARQLVEDLERHLAHQPLRHAPEPSPRERARKFARRHPRLTSLTSLALVSGALVLGLGTAVAARDEQLARFEARETLARFEDGLREARYYLNVWIDDQEKRPRGLAEARRARALYGAPGEPDWQRRAAVTRLEPSARDRLREGVAELLLLEARALEYDARGAPGRPPDRALGRAALRLNEQAEACERPGTPTRALISQRARLTEALGRADEARRLRQEADRLPLLSARDHYLEAAERLAGGDAAKALPLLDAVKRLDPENYWACFLSGWAHERLQQDDLAVACYDTCIALRPKHHSGWYNRALVLLRQKRFGEAKADLDEALRLRPGEPEFLIDRALVEIRLKQYHAAIADLDRAEAREAHPARLYLVRARARRGAGDLEGARLDEEEGLRRVPTDALSCLARAYARLATDPAQALADYEKALTFNPSSFYALWNKAEVLSEKLGRTEEAVAVYDRLLDLYPAYTPAWSMRGVMLGRLGRRAAALRDADRALQDPNWTIKRDDFNAILYQVAGIYALTSREEPDDAPEALRLLALSLRRGVDLDLIDKDRDLDPIRGLPEFERLVAAARARKQPGAGPPRAGP